VLHSDPRSQYFKSTKLPFLSSKPILELFNLLQNPIPGLVAK